MRRIISGIVLMGWITDGQAQETPRTMLQQIVALRGYITTAEEGDQVIEQGIYTIRDIRNGEFQLHSKFFSALPAINPAIKNVPRTEDMAWQQVSLIDQFFRWLTQWRSDGLMHAEELSYAEQVYNNLVALAAENMNALFCLTMKHGLKMTDGERILHILIMEQDMQQQNKIVDDFIYETNRLNSDRSTEKLLSLVKKLNEIP
jgi:hypothetical protein